MLLKPLIDGKPHETSESFEDRDPADGSLICEVGKCDARDVDIAVRAARAAFNGVWGKMQAPERGRLLRHLGELILREGQQLAEMESRDVGKPISQAWNDIRISARYFEYYGAAVEALHGETLQPSENVFAFTVRMPHGVTAHITPWNYPLQIAARTLAPALAAGNCAVHKPAEDTPNTAVRLAELALEAGFPPGALNVVLGPGDTGAVLSQHAGIDHISFTGSVETGRLVGHAAAETVIPATFELGGKSPNIVFAGADLEAAVPTIVGSIIQNAGQTCTAGSRLLVEDSIHEEILQAVADRFSRVTIGRGLDDPDLGPLLNAKQHERVMHYIDVGKREAQLVCGGARPSSAGLSAGFFVEPTLFDGADGDAVISQEEIFGPVLTVSQFKGEDEAIRLANSTDYGLISAVWTSDTERALRVADSLRSGQVFVNNYGAGGGVELPFGGVKRSGFGREKGLEALQQYTVLKTVAIRRRSRHDGN